MSFVLKHLIRPKVIAIVVILEKRSWNVQEQPPIFFSFLTYKEIFLRPSGSGGELRPIEFGLTAPGVIFVSQLLVH